ncbi:hypothetical protein RUND412_007883 [Rhizina undulata]
MIIDALYTYPVKSLLPIQLSTARLTEKGPQYDRVFLLQRAHREGPENVRWENMHIGVYDELCLFQPRFSPTEENPEALVVRYLGENTDGKKEITIPLEWDVEAVGMLKVEVNMHKSQCDAWVMEKQFGEFFSRAFDYEVRLLWLGTSNGRKVLGNVPPGAVQENVQGTGSWWGKLSNAVIGAADESPDWRIGFADCAPLMISTISSLMTVEQLVGKTDMKKFRPNIVLALENGEKGEAWDEDYWGALTLGEGVEVVLTANCARCKSINVDFATGKQLPSTKQPLKALMKDRRIDPGMKYSPIFGRYGFVSRKSLATSGGVKVRAGDSVSVLKRNNERTVFCKFFYEQDLDVTNFNLTPALNFRLAGDLHRDKKNGGKHQHHLTCDCGGY